MKVSGTIFREYDIRGIVGDDLTVDVVQAVGRAYASRMREMTGLDAPRITVGHDNRPSSPELARAMCDGLNASGADVILIDTVPTPTLYFADREFGTDGGIQITGSHNPSEYNGIKMVAGGNSLYGDAIQDLRRRIEADSTSTAGDDGAQGDSRSLRGSGVGRRRHFEADQGGARLWKRNRKRRGAAGRSRRRGSK